MTYDLKGVILDCYVGFPCGLLMFDVGGPFCGDWQKPWMHFSSPRYLKASNAKLQFIAGKSGVIVEVRNQEPPRKANVSLLPPKSVTHGELARMKSFWVPRNDGCHAALLLPTKEPTKSCIQSVCRETF